MIHHRHLAIPTIPLTGEIQMETTSKRPYRSKFKRQDHDPMELTERDIAMLAGIGRCRFLKTDLIHRLVSEASSKQGVQRRLKKLYNNGLVERHQAFVRLGEAPTSIVYSLTRRGADLLGDAGIQVTVYKQKKPLSFLFLDHTLSLAEFRINMELATRNHSSVQLDTFICDFEVRPESRQEPGRKRYKAYEAFRDHRRKKMQFIYPDARFVLSAKSSPNTRMLYFLEVDRGTERLEIIRNKLAAYASYLQEQAQPIERDGQLLGFQTQQHGLFFGIKILFQCQGEKRAKNIQRCIDSTGLLARHNLVAVTNVGRINQETILSGDIWLDIQGKRQRLLK